MGILEEINAAVSAVVWGPVTLLLLLAVGVYFSVKTGFLQVRRFGTVLRETMLKFFDKKKGGGISPAEALSTALAGTMGTGNIAGVATALTIGGPGAIFWMWVSAFFGMMTKYAEVFLAVRYRRQDKTGAHYGGPMYYMEDGLKSRALGCIFAALGLAASFGIGNLAQVNSISQSLHATFHVPPLVTGIVVAAALGLVITGGARRVYGLSKWIVPIMTILYMAGAVFVMVRNAAQIPGAFGDIVRCAFAPAPAVGGFAGAGVSGALRIGFARGVFSNEAGMGSAPIAHAAAETDSAARQGLWGIFEVFADTIVSCTLTALIILVTGVWHSGASGAVLTVMAFESEMGAWGGGFVAVSILFFAFASILGWSYYGEKCIEYLTKGHRFGVYRALFLGVLVVGSIGGLELIWGLSDTLNGLMAIPNIIALILLRREVVRGTKREIGRL